MNEFTVSIRGEAVLARMKGAADRFHAAMLRVITRLSIEIQGDVKTKKLTGQVLHVRTGTLRRSINRHVVDSQDGVIGKVGTNVSYAAVHEYGFSGAVNVRQHTRKTRNGGEANVRAHVREMHMPERSFLRSAVRDNRARIFNEIKAAGLAELRK